MEGAIQALLQVVATQKEATRAQQIAHQDAMRMYQDTLQVQHRTNQLLREEQERNTRELREGLKGLADQIGAQLPAANTQRRDDLKPGSNPATSQSRCAGHIWYSHK